jgi:cytidylate kinase
VTASVIAIDGPAGSGKTVVGKMIADALGYVYLDTGALYRAITLLALRDDVPLDNGPAIARLAAMANLEFERPTAEDGRLYTVLLNGDDVTPRLTSPEVASAVSIVAAHPEVRAELLPLQRRIANRGRVVIAGRDIGTVVCPSADLKLFLDAPLPVRVARRIEQLRLAGRQPDPAAVAAEVAERDRIDQGRAVAPLRPAPDAVVIDTSSLTVEQEVALILGLIAQRS